MTKEPRPSFPIGINVFVVRDGKILLGLRKNVFGDGSWGLPGGHLEDREGMTSAAHRELKEETGLEAKSFKFIGLANNAERGNGQHYIQIGFLAQHVTGEPQLTEPDKCSEWRWFNLNELPEPIFIGHQQLLRLFQEKKEMFADDAGVAPSPYQGEGRGEVE